MPATGEGSMARTRPAVTDAGPAAPEQRPRPPVVVVGAGPIGLAAAAHLLERGERPLVLEAGAMVGASVAQW